MTELETGSSESMPNAGDDAESLVPVELGERHFGRYVLRYEIASGGMATVFLARARGPAGFDRPLALKRIHPHLAKRRDFVDMFLDEARLAARISHPNVCSVFDFGEVDGTYYMAMEYLVGQPLAALLRVVHQRPEIASSTRWRVLAARIIADACEGLHAAHELRGDDGSPLGVVHRDVSPHNIFVTYDGAVKVVDFGVAWAEERLHQTQTGALKGKLGYMSPEQIKGKAIDRRLDVWSLGVCLWELLTLRRLFSRRVETEVLEAVAREPIPPPSAILDGVPATLEAVVMRALDRNVDGRHPTARAMARELNAYVSSSGVGAGLADLSELMEELFEEERATKLGVVASVLATGSEQMLQSNAPSRSGERVVAPVQRQAPPRVETPAPPPPEEPEHEEPEVEPEPRARGVGPAEPRDEPQVVPERAKRRWPLAVAAVIAIVGAAAGGAFLHSALPSSSSPEPGAPAPVAAASHTPIEEPAAPEPREPRPPRAAEVASSLRSSEEPRVEHRRGTGTVAVAARGGWADIYVGGESHGRTPRSFPLAAGRQVIELHPNGHLPARRVTVTVEPGETTRVVVPLD